MPVNGSGCGPRLDWLRGVRWGPIGGQCSQLASHAKQKSLSLRLNMIPHLPPCTKFLSPIWPLHLMYIAGPQWTFPVSLSPRLSVRSYVTVRPSCEKSFFLCCVNGPGSRRTIAFSVRCERTRRGKERSMIRFAIDRHGESYKSMPLDLYLTKRNSS